MSTGEAWGQGEEGLPIPESSGLSFLDPRSSGRESTLSLVNEDKSRLEGAVDDAVVVIARVVSSPRASAQVILPKKSTCLRTLPERRQSLELLPNPLSYSSGLASVGSVRVWS